MEAMVSRLEEAHRRELQLTWTEVQVLSDKFKAEESAVASLEAWITELEKEQSSQTSQTSSIQLRLEEYEDRSRRNNLRFRGLPEDIEEESLYRVVLSICQKLGVTTAPKEIKFDRLQSSGATLHRLDQTAGCKQLPAPLCSSGGSYLWGYL